MIYLWILFVTQFQLKVWVRQHWTTSKSARVLKQSNQSDQSPTHVSQAVHRAAALGVRPFSSKFTSLMPQTAGSTGTTPKEVVRDKTMLLKWHVSKFIFPIELSCCEHNTVHPASCVITVYTVQTQTNFMACPWGAIKGNYVSSDGRPLSCSQHDNLVQA